MKITVLKNDDKSVDVYVQDSNITMCIWRAVNVELSENEENITSFVFSRCSLIIGAVYIDKRSVAIQLINDLNEAGFYLPHPIYREFSRPNIVESC